MVFVAPVKYYSCTAQCEGLSWILVIRTLGSSSYRSFSEYSCPVVRQHVYKFKIGTFESNLV